MKKRIAFVRLGRMTSGLFLGLVGLSSSGGAPESIDGVQAERDVATNQAAATTEDGLADAYALFKQIFVNNGSDQDFTMGFAFHPALSTEKLVGSAGHMANGVVTLHFATETIHAVVVDAPANAQLDLWFVKNVAGAGRTVKPGSGDLLLKVGSFKALDGALVLDANVGNNVNFDLDMVVLTRRGQSPTASRIAVGSRTILEKRFFRE